MKRLLSRLLPVVLVGLLVVGLGNRKLKRLTPAERVHFEALDVFMDKDQTKAFLKLKTEEERNAFLKSAGLWEQFYQYDAETRAAIATGDVKVGWSRDMVYMAWNAPHTKQRATTLQAAGLTEQLLYNFLLLDDGRVVLWSPGDPLENAARKKFRVVLTLVDRKVVELEKRDGFR